MLHSARLLAALVVLCAFCVTGVAAPAPYSVDLRWRVVFLYWDGYGITSIVKLLHISRQSCVRFLARYFRTGDVDSAPWRRGRELKLTPEVQLAVEEYVLEDATVYLKELCTWVFSVFGVTVSCPTMCRLLRQKLGLSRTRVRCNPSAAGDQQVVGCCSSARRQVKPKQNSKLPS